MKKLIMNFNNGKLKKKKKRRKVMSPSWTQSTDKVQSQPDGSVYHIS
jgi:hypothetical protein